MILLQTSTTHVSRACRLPECLTIEQTDTKSCTDPAASMWVSDIDAVGDVHACPIMRGFYLYCQQPKGQAANSEPTIQPLSLYSFKLRDCCLSMWAVKSMSVDKMSPCSKKEIVH
ncbi:hypothetical protein CEXT_90681 [Caerostris extrusa]|uniref:Uncharacterized protein n=1 Tax=Caerostris extrusa TaxID=172846 RepID=A0AAV4Q1C0_CAEEX|nr:hypothetical protein CEXT_90681 [Caerostris extrusa]